jgi:ubiquinone/menaquinone biosynthesis C-methylase UbiE
MIMTQPAVKGYKGMGMEGWVAKWYAANTGKDRAQYRTLARSLAEDLGPGSAVLEVAPGPGFLAIDLAKTGKATVTGLDISKPFVEIARKNAQREGVSVDFQLGNASAMPFPGDSFDLIVCRAAFKNFSEPVQALVEMHRVLKPGGKAMVIDLRKDVPMEAVDTHVKNAGVGFFSGVFMKLTFRTVLVKRAYTKAQFQEFISQTPFQKSEIREDGLGFEISLWK